MQHACGNSEVHAVRVQQTVAAAFLQTPIMKTCGLSAGMQSDA